jgi:hypothetical protein
VSNFCDRKLEQRHNGVGLSCLASTRSARRCCLLLLAVATLIFVRPVMALASVGAGVGASPIVLTSVARPGHTYRLPSLYVINTGTVASVYRVRVDRLTPGPELAVPPDWIHFDLNDFLLEPRQTASVPITLNVPANAAPGSYVSDLVAGTVPERAPGSTTAVGAQAATKLMFHVGSGASFPWPGPWWAYGLAVLVVLSAAAVFIQRRLGLRFNVERRR